MEEFCERSLVSVWFGGDLGSPMIALLGLIKTRSTCYSAPHIASFGSCCFSMFVANFIVFPSFFINVPH